MLKTKNIILRLDEKTNNSIELKSDLVSLSKSEFIRQAATEYWPQSDNGFKSLLEMYDSHEDRREVIIEAIFQHYRKIGFPFSSMSENQLLKDMASLASTPSPLLEDNYLQLNTVGIRIANHFHPQMFGVRYSNSSDVSPMDYFNDDDHLRDCINRNMELGRTCNRTNLRRMLKTRDGVRCVVNFKPAIAKFLYSKYVPSGGRVLDFCSGYSGRLVGCISTRKNIHYEGIDPDARAAIGNMKCAALFAGQYDTLGTRIYPFDFSFHLGCAEDVMPKLQAGTYDFIFTSPPYFNVERYSEVENQSYIRHDSYDIWRKNFLHVCLNEAKRLLKPTGYLAINTKDYKKMPIMSDVEAYCKEIGLEQTETFQMKLANKEFNLKKKTFQTEPIMVFKNKENYA